MGHQRFDHLHAQASRPKTNLPMPQAERELLECTFKPSLLAPSHATLKQAAREAPTPQGYVKAVERMRRVGEIKEMQEAEEAEQARRRIALNAQPARPFVFETQKRHDRAKRPPLMYIDVRSCRPPLETAAFYCFIPMLTFALGCMHLCRSTWVLGEQDASDCTMMTTRRSSHPASLEPTNWTLAWKRNLPS